MKFGEHNNNWRGDSIGYRAAHMRVNSVNGHASEYQCLACGENAHEWSYDGCDPSEQVDPRGRSYSPDPRHYDPLCRSCHRFNDAVYRRAARAAENAAQSLLAAHEPQTQGSGGGRCSRSNPGRGSRTITFLDTATT